MNLDARPSTAFRIGSVRQPTDRRTFDQDNEW